MNNKFFSFALIFLFGASVALFAQEGLTDTDENFAEDFSAEGETVFENENATKKERPSKSKKTPLEERSEKDVASENYPTIDDLCADQYHFGLLHNWGVAWATVTRVQKKGDVSNFVWNDKMIGAFYELWSHDFKRYNDFWSLNFMGRMAVFYPYRYRFRDVPQAMTQTILYNLDWFTSPVLSYNLFGWVQFDLGIGLHMSYQKHDMWNYFNLGAGAKLDAEFPLSSRWTILMGGMFCWDNGNLGSNREMRPFDFVWEWQAQFGFRYSKKYLNRFSYIKYKPRPIKQKKGARKTRSERAALEGEDASAESSGQEEEPAENEAANLPGEIMNFSR